ncbi:MULTISPECIES: hypothetical protein [Paraburkholderia]|uniref:hypothetical protein n=1 Tax=Paraburkholderia TaxID=1822464 RepID=UPI00037EC756|nr:MULTISPECIES: hypothetical protein [Paraburkholderia]MDH6146938.1 hypothetical protein [Paraburkholderia sp. WSM4179]
MNDEANQPDASQKPQGEPADRQEGEAQRNDSARDTHASPRAPGSNKLSDVAPEDVDKVVPRDREETKLHDHSLGDADERDKPDAAGNLPGTL